MDLNQTIRTYCSLMEEIKLRYEVITTCLTKPVLRPRIMYELCYLQLRMICELIALGCLVAHGDIRETHSKKMRETWEADRIMKTLGTLHAKFYPKPIRYIEDDKGTPTRYQPIFLYRWPVPECGLSGAFWRREFILGNLEEARRARLERMCDDKFAKLPRWKRDEGAHTVLVMEENDLSSTNHQLVAEAMARAEAGRPDTPDKIFLISTVRPNPWWVTCLRREGANYYDDGERFHELDPASLTQLTSR